MNYLENEYMRLRAPESEDVDFLYRWENDTSVWLSGNTLVPFSKNILKKYIETAHQDIFESKQLRFMIDLKSSGNYKTIGTIDLFDFDPQHLRAGVGILIADVTERKKGYATDALQMLVLYCFAVMGLHQLYCSIGADNKSSIALFEKTGFVKAGIKKEWNRRGGGWEDEIFYQIINRK